MKRLLPLLVLVLLAGLAAPAVAAPPFTETSTEQGVTFTMVDFGPTCEDEGPLYEITLTYNSVEHVTAFDDGRVHFGFTWAGTFEAVPLDGGQYHSGHFGVRVGFNQNNQGVNGTSTFSLTGQFVDGTKFGLHEVEHFNTPPTGAANFFSRCHD